MSKKSFSRNGVTRTFTQEVIDNYSTEGNPYPESQGWVAEPVEMKDLAQTASLKIAEQGKPVEVPSEPAQVNGEPEAKGPSSEYTTTDVDQIKEKLATSSIEEVNAFFAGETRVTMTRLRDALIADFNSANQETPEAK